MSDFDHQDTAGGKRSGVAWILDQYKEKTPKDRTIREEFNAYRFADDKKKGIDPICRVAQVSVETMEIIEAMKAARGLTPLHASPDPP